MKVSADLIYDENSPAVQAHLSITQSIIQRMAANSASCKAWCITLVAAILVIVAGQNKPRFALIAGIPALLFLVLDAYYLALEREFRRTYNAFIQKLHDGDVGAADLYSVEPSRSIITPLLSAILSFSIWPFYLTLGFLIWASIMIIS